MKPPRVRVVTLPDGRSFNYYPDFNVPDTFGPDGMPDPPGDPRWIEYLLKRVRERGVQMTLPGLAPGEKVAR